MIATILSDLHLDFWFNKKRKPNPKQIKDVFDGYLDPNPEVEVLLVAGDISNINYQISILDDIAEAYNYKKVFCVLGNHDLYASDEMNSRQRQEEYYKYKSDTTTILNGTCETYRGVKFGGAMGWYDGTRNRPVGWTKEMVIKAWKGKMNDHYYISGYKDMYEVLNQELPKVEAVLDADVILSHVCPTTNNMASPEEFRFGSSGMFFAFEGHRYIEKTNAKYWVFGHTHGDVDMEMYGTRLVMHTLGYPKERSDKSIVNIEIV